MFKRSDYTKGKVTHDSYYGQFVDSNIIDLVRESIGEKSIRNSKCEHFNDIPLYRFDNIAGYCLHYAKHKINLAIETASLSVGVCIAKQAAKQIKASL